MKLISVLDKINKLIEKVFIFCAGLLLVSMVLITCANIVLRWVWLPLRGTFELMGLMGAIVATFALAYTQARKEHISVDILIDHLPKTLQRFFAVINDLACIIFSAIASWQLIKLANTLMTSGEVTETLRIIFYPFTYAVALGFIAISLVFFTDICKFLFLKGDQQ